MEKCSRCTHRRCRCCEICLFFPCRCCNECDVYPCRCREVVVVPRSRCNTSRCNPSSCTPSSCDTCQPRHRSHHRRPCSPSYSSSSSDCDDCACTTVILSKQCMAVFKRSATGVVTTVVTPYVQPAVDATVTITVGTTAPFIVGELLYIESGGSYTVMAIPSATTVEIKNLMLQGSTAPGDTVADGSNIVGTDVKCPHMRGHMSIDLRPKRDTTCPVSSYGGCCGDDSNCPKVLVLSPDHSTGLPVYFEYCKVLLRPVTSFMVRAPCNHNIGTWELQYQDTCYDRWITAFGPVSSIPGPDTYDITKGLMIMLPCAQCSSTWRIKVNTLADNTKSYVQLCEFNLYEDVQPQRRHRHNSTFRCCCPDRKRESHLCRCRADEFRHHRFCK